MFTKKTNPSAPPQTATAWRVEHARLEGELADVQAQVNGESARRQKFAVAAAGGDAEAEKEFNRSFTTETQLRKDLERLNALVVHADRQAAEAAAAAEATAERERRAALDQAWTRQRQVAARVDAALQSLGIEAAAFMDGFAEIRKLGGSGPRRLASSFALAAKFYALREIFDLHVVGPGSSLSHQLQVRAHAAGQSTEEAA